MTAPARAANWDDKFLFGVARPAPQSLQWKKDQGGWFTPFDRPGMTGPYDSIIGVEKDAVIHRFLTGMPSRFETAKGDPRFAAAVVDVDEQTGRARSIDRMLLTENDIGRL